MLVLIPIFWAFMIRSQIANLIYNFLLSIIWTSNLQMKNVNPFFMFTLQVPMVQKMPFWTPFVICTFGLKFWNTLGLQFSKWENYLRMLRFTFPHLWECVRIPKHSPSLFPPCFLPWSWMQC
jgi:hypothetical protein